MTQTYDPLLVSLLLGFAEDYQKILVNVKHEHIITRSGTDLNAVIQEGTADGQTPPGVTYEKFKINISKIEWLMPYVIVSDRRKIPLLNFIGKDKPISISIRSWEFFVYPSLLQTSRHVWTVKTSNQLEKPRFVILGFQTKRKDKPNLNASRFDHCNITNIKLFLNSQYYPYGNLNLDINRSQFAMLYDMFANFQSAYYNKNPEPALNRLQFIKHMPLIVIDCSRQNESVRNASVDVRLEFESKDNFPTDTAAYCLIIHDRIVQYNPVSGDVKKMM